ncbi:hypothetical protein DSM112329_03406 [Paraconexibacter sp. AEG42_29]|uniref:HTH tetR-type domain-containing protein n=1 Tax=Paraconexibacter sp. AEG42_29 TaxID=2997339 RepID=A0AAU7AXU2_9ACTN
MARSRATDNEALVRAAAAVFESRGYRNTTIDDIADAAGVSRPTVYKYTSSKRALLDRVVDTVCEDLADDLAALHRGSGPAPERLRQLVQLHVTSAIKLRTFYTILFSEQAELSDEARARFHVFSHQTAVDMQALIGECLALRPAGQAPVDTRIAANLVLSMLTSLYRWYDPDGEVSPEALVDEIVGVLAGIVPRARAGRRARPPAPPRAAAG